MPNAKDAPTHHASATTTTSKPMPTDVSAVETAGPASPMVSTSTPPTDAPNKNKKPPSRLKLTYDIAMLVAIVIDLFLIGLDAVMMSSFANHVGGWLAIMPWIEGYRDNIHEPLRTAGGYFTIFLVLELLVRWAVAIKEQRYFRWFFFPFVHWYEVLGCFPQLRALRLLRALVIGHRLYQLGYQVLPQSWIDRGKFYFDLVLEELSDRVILTAVDNLRTQLADSKSNQSLVQSTIDKNRDEIEAMLASMLRQELIPRLQASLTPTNGVSPLAADVGAAVQDALTNTPELRRYLKMIPIAGGLIEGQMLSIGQHVGENVANAVNKRLLDEKSLNALMDTIAHGVASIDTTNPALENLVASIVEDSLTAFEKQVKVQQWKHQSQMNF